MLKNVKQNVVLLMEPCDSAADVSLKAGNMLLNRFCIDEDAAFESTGVYYLEKARLSARKEKGKRKYTFILIIQKSDNNTLYNNRSCY